MAAPVASSASTSLQWDKPPALKSARKKSNPLLLIAVIAVVVLCISGVYRATHQAPPSQWIKVVGAANDIPAGTKLSFTSLSYIEFPKQFVNKDMSTSLVDVSGYIAKTYIPKGEPITAAMVFKNRNGMSYSLENDERAITLQLNEDALVDHEILPDDRVDVLVVSSKDGNKYTKTICQDARVLLSAPKSQTFGRQSGGSAADRITLAVGSPVAERITEAMEVGKIRLILRNRLERQSQRVFGAAPDDLLPASAFQPPPSAKVKPDTAREMDAAAMSALVPPPVAGALQNVIASPPAPIQWVVDMFFGSKKETLTVPQQ